MSFSINWGSYGGRTEDPDEKGRATFLPIAVTRMG